jgi:hypothetical protein
MNGEYAGSMLTYKFPEGEQSAEVSLFFFLGK